MAYLLEFVKHKSTDTGPIIEVRELNAARSSTTRDEKIGSAVSIITFPSDALSSQQSALLISQLTLVELFASVSNGLLTVCITHNAKDLDLPQHLICWPSTVTGLVSGSLLLVSGSIADVIGSRVVNQTGNLLLDASPSPAVWPKRVRNLLRLVHWAGVGLLSTCHLRFEF